MRIPDVLIGTFQITDQNIMDSVVRAAVSVGAYGFDTAPSYNTEIMLGNSIAFVISEGLVKREDLFIQDKIDAMQMYRFRNHGIKKFVQRQLKKLNTEYLDALLIHWPFRQYFDGTWHQMLSLKEGGYVKQIGVCNIDERGFELLFRNDPSGVDIIQNEISPLNADSANVDFFKGYHLEIEAYSPFCRMNKMIRDDAGIGEIAKSIHADIGQVILRWHIQRGIHPIFSSHKAERIKSNLALDFTLDKDQMEYINNMDRDYKIFPISHGCPGY